MRFCLLHRRVRNAGVFYAIAAVCSPRPGANGLSWDASGDVSNVMNVEGHGPQHKSCSVVIIFWCDSRSGFREDSCKD